MSSHKVSHSLCPICKVCKRTISHINLGILPLSGHNVILCTSQSEQMTSLHRVCCGHLLFLVDKSVVYWRPTELSFYTTIRPNTVCFTCLLCIHSFSTTTGLVPVTFGVHQLLMFLSPLICIAPPLPQNLNRKKRDIKKKNNNNQTA